MKGRLAPILALVAGTCQSHAQIVASEDFEGYDTGSELSGQSGGSGFTGSWSVNPERADDVTIVDASLSYSNGTVNADGGARALQFAFEPAEGGGITDGIMVRALETVPTGTVYMSLLFRDTANDGFANDFIQWGFDAGTTNPNASIIRRNGSLQARSTTDPNSSADSGVPAEIGTTRMLVFKAEKTGGGNYDRVSLFVDPDSELEPVTPSAVSATDSGLSSFPNFVARSAFHEEGDTFLIDNLVIGSTWEEVVISTPPVPFAITRIEYDPGAGSVTLTWTSTPFGNYGVYFSTDCVDWSADLNDSIDGDAGETTSATFDLGQFGIADLPDLFFRVERN